MPRKHGKQVSMYQSFWETLKKRKAIVVKVPPEYIERFVKAIKKRKDRDHELKSLNAIDPLKLEISRQPNHPQGSRVVVMLKQSIGISDIMLPEAVEASLAELSLEDI